MVSLNTPVCEFGKPAIDFALPGVDGEVWTLDGCRGPRGLLVMFICNHCPYVKAIRERLVRDTRDLRELGVNSVAIMSNDPDLYPEDSYENMQAVAREFHFPFPYLMDKAQDVARAYGAICTPDFFGYNSKLELQYRGRFDASGKQPAPDNAERDLYQAMHRIAETGQGPAEQFPGIGCSIKWRAE
ncbi:MAG TPA: thioredoxin family protein [Gammaproteobacteria bacterium]|nr:thioredoxin family protein [Gammaproteobacteria bacterium]